MEHSLFGRDYWLCVCVTSIVDISATLCSALLESLITNKCILEVYGLLVQLSLLLCHSLGLNIVSHGGARILLSLQWYVQGTREVHTLILHYSNDFFLQLRDACW